MLSILRVADASLIDRTTIAFIALVAPSPCNNPETNEQQQRFLVG
jgi:hypothetical protein